jgi:DNA-binding NarL/FixJ family response regulator
MATDGPAAIMAVEEHAPDVAVLSTDLPNLDGIQTSCQIKAFAPECAIIVLTDAQDQRLLTDGLYCGARGYLTKDCSVAELVGAIRAVASGETLIPPGMLGPLLTDLIDRRREHEGALMKLAALSTREREVLGLVSKGLKTSELTDALVISPETARTHIQNILSKLGLHSRLEAATFVIENGLLETLQPPAGVAATSSESER